MLLNMEVAVSRQPESAQFNRNLHSAGVGRQVKAHLPTPLLKIPGGEIERGFFGLAGILSEVVGNAFEFPVGVFDLEVGHQLVKRLRTRQKIILRADIKRDGEFVLDLFQVQFEKSGGMIGLIRFGE